MKALTPVLLAALISVPVKAAEYPSFYKNVAKRSNYKNAIAKDDWYMPTAQQRALVKGILSEDLSEWGMQWKVQEIAYDPNFYEGIRRLGAESGCLMYRYLRGYLAKPFCFAEPLGKQTEKQPFIAKNSQFYQQPLIIDSPQQPTADDSLRYEFWVPAGADYQQHRHFYPLQQLGLDVGVSRSDNLLITAFLTVYQNNEGKWSKLKLSNSPITLVLKIPSAKDLKATKSPAQAYRNSEHSVRILDFRE